MTSWTSSWAWNSSISATKHEPPSKPTSREWPEAGTRGDRIDSAAVPPPTIGEAAATVFGYLRGLHATHYLDLGIRMGLFSALAKKPQSADALARDLALHPPSAPGFSHTAHHLETLHPKGPPPVLAP